MCLVLTLESEGVVAGVIAIDTDFPLFGGVWGTTLEYRYIASLADGQQYQGAFRHPSGDGFRMAAEVLRLIAEQQQFASR